ncbi:RnfH family protein [Zooshikella sp. RANM57]|uniref:RnfH family protein n=1 Tax=Zooshikella sp. RANM57 TaxID=3425863 RepID=UPI003D6DD4BC
MADIAEEQIKVEVAYALANKQKVVVLNVPKGSSVYEAAIASKLDQEFKGIDWDTAKMGIFGKLVPKPKERVLDEGERVEIYRPLIADPKEVRKRRAEKAKLAKQAESPD